MTRNNIQQIRRIIKESVRQALYEGILSRDLKKLMGQHINEIYENGEMHVQIGNDVLTVKITVDNNVFVEINGKTGTVPCLDVGNEKLLVQTIIAAYAML